jgi:hypothetical protein
VYGKPTLKFDGQLTWAEFILLRLIERDGWKGAWIKNFHGRREFWQNPGEPTVLPTRASNLLQMVEDTSGGTAGCWDILAARGDDYLIIESKQRGGDRIKPNQAKWMEIALELRVPPWSFGIVEWEAPKP